MTLSLDRSPAQNLMHSFPKSHHRFHLAKVIPLVLVALLLQMSCAAHASSQPNTVGSTLPRDVGGSSDLIQQIIDSAKVIMPGLAFQSISFGLKDEKIGVYFSDAPNYPLRFWLEDGVLVADGRWEYPKNLGEKFSISDLELLVPNFDSISEDVEAFAEANNLGIDKRTFLDPDFSGVHGASFSVHEPVVVFWLGDPTEARSSGNYPLLYRVYSMRSGDLLWQATADDTDVVFQFFTA